MARIGQVGARTLSPARLGAVTVLVALAGLPCLRAAEPIRVIRPEDYQRSTVPKEPDNRAAPVELPQRRVDVSDDKTVLVKSLLGVRLVPLPKDVVANPAVRGIEVKNIPLLEAPEFHGVLQPYLGKPVTMRSISLMIRDTVAYYQGKDRPVVDVFVPEQEITGGVVQLLVVEARVGQVKVTGMKYFNEGQIRHQISLKPGDVIQAGRLLADMDYINSNPFRFVRPVLQPGKEFGTTDVIADGRDRMPVRFYGGYEDTGSRDTGLQREFVGFNAGNFLGLGHEAGYQYTTSRHVADFGIHSAYWRIPLPNRDRLSFYGNWAAYETHHNATDLDSDNWMASVRYTTALPARGTLRHELEFGVDFRQASNDFSVGGHTAYRGTVDVTQLAFQYAGRDQDRAGETSWTANLYWSPFEGVTGHQNDHDYNLVRPDAQAQYAYARTSVERTWWLPKDWTFYNRFTGQAASDRLIPTEQLGLGGYDTVRGFDDREVNSDEGVTATLELRTPEADLGPFGLCGDKDLRHYLQFLVFTDYGHAWNRGHAEGEMKDADMLSVGVGLRYRINNNVKLRLDYGHKLEDVSGSPSGDGRIHLFLIVSY
ncbi:MAG: hypothetical protein NTV86_15280 [Planctomycetota bacterium]|nr:hypothetical protein [Planctomycetota bacterium]